MRTLLKALIATLSLTFAVGSVSAQVCEDPVARQDRISLPAGASPTYSLLLPSPLWNDSSASGRSLTLEMTLPQGEATTGRLESGPDGQLRFTGTRDAVQTRYFSYTVRDGNRTDEGTIRVAEGLDFEAPPVIAPDYFEVPQGCTETPLEVLGNDAVPGGVASADLVAILYGPLTYGAVTIERRDPPLVDRLRYRPQPCSTFTGRDEFEYQVEVSGELYTGHVVIDVLPGTPPPGPYPCFNWLEPNFARHPLEPVEIQRDGVFDVSCARQSRGSEFPPAEVCWDFGDGTPLVGTPGCADGGTYDIGPLCSSIPCLPGRRHVHRYAQLGTYVVRQRARVGSTWSEWTGRQVTVSNAPPDAALAAIECFALDCPLDASGTTDDFDAPEGLVYTWDFGDDTPFGTGPTLSHRYADLGTYPLTLVVTDSQGGIDVESRVVQVADRPPQARFTVSASCGDRCLSLLATTLDDFGLAGHEWRWQRVSDGAAGLLGVGGAAELRSSLLGLYDVTLVATDGAGQTGTRTERVELSGALRAGTDWWILPPGATSVALDPRSNDAPGSGLTITAFGQGQNGAVSLLPDGKLRYELTGARPTITDRFSYTVTNGAGESAQGTVRIVTRPIGEVGRVEGVTDGPRGVPFRAAYASPPLVFALPASANDPEPAAARITSVKPESFTVRVQEPGEGAHGAETIDYLVVVPPWSGETGSGLGSLEDGRPFAAGRFVLGQTLGNGAPDSLDRWAWVSLPRSIGLSGPAVVLAQVQTSNDSSWVTARVDGVSETGFRVALEVPEAASGHGAETVAWVAFPAGSSPSDAALLSEALAAGPKFTAAFDGQSFGRRYPVPPLVVGALSSRHDGDPAVLRRRLVGVSSVELAVQEDATRDAEASHGAEAASLVVFAEPAVLAGSTRTLLPADGGGLVGQDDDFSVVASGPSWLPILTNDQPGTGDLEILGFTQPAFGGLSLEGPGGISLEGSLLYHLPAPEFRGLDYFEYTVRDGAGNRATLTAWIKVVGENEQ